MTQRVSEDPAALSRHSPAPKGRFRPRDADLTEEPVESVLAHRTPLAGCNGIGMGPDSSERTGHALQSCQQINRQDGRGLPSLQCCTAVRLTRGSASEWLLIKGSFQLVPPAGLNSSFLREWSAMRDVQWPLIFFCLSLSTWGTEAMNERSLAALAAKRPFPSADGESRQLPSQRALQDA